MYVILRLNGTSLFGREFSGATIEVLLKVRNRFREILLRKQYDQSVLPKKKENKNLTSA